MKKDKDTAQHKYSAERGVALSEHEREAMREELKLFMAEHPVALTFSERFAQYASGFHVPAVSVGLRPALAALLIVFVVGTGTSYAAADALPGDALYVVKTRINEPLRVALATSDKTKAEVNAELATRRLEEAEILASQGRLSSDARIEIESRFNEHAQRFEERANILAQNEASIEFAADAQSDLEASLRAHAAILADLSISIPASEVEITPIARAVNDRVQAVERARLAVERTIAVRTGESIRIAALAKRQIIEGEVSTIARASTESANVMALSAVRVAEDSSGDEEIVKEDPIEAAYRSGSQKLSEGAYGEAFASFQSAIRSLKQKQLDSAVRARLKIPSALTFVGGDESAAEAEEESVEEADEEDAGFAAEEESGVAPAAASVVPSERPAATTTGTPTSPGATSTSGTLLEELSQELLQLERQLGNPNQGSVEFETR